VLCANQVLKQGSVHNASANSDWLRPGAIALTVTPVQGIFQTHPNMRTPGRTDAGQGDLVSTRGL